MEWVRRNSIQLRAAGSPIAINAMTAASATSRPGRSHARRPGAWLGALAVGLSARGPEEPEELEDLEEPEEPALNSLALVLMRNYALW